jgi:hypothetical protein
MAQKIKQPTKNKMIQSLYTYWLVEGDQGFWVFDFPSLAVEKEPFVSGIPEILEMLLAPDPVALEEIKRKGFVILFDGHSKECPDALKSQGIILNKLRAESGGTIYQLEGTSFEGWLCPVLNKFFSESPERIFVAFARL